MLLISPAGSGKSEAALTALHTEAPNRGLLLVPSQLQKELMHTRLEPFPRSRVCQFDDLATVILRQGGRAPKGLGPTARMILLRRLLHEQVAAGVLPTFAPAAQRAGFVALLGDLLAELAQADIAPAQLATANVTPYDADLATCYAAYTQFLAQHNFADLNRRLALARDALHQNPRLLRNVQLLVVDGFDQFTPLQLSLLAAVCQRVNRFFITLTGEAAPRPAHRRFTRTRQALHAALPGLREELRPPATPPARHPELVHVERHLFSLDPPPASTCTALHVIAAADREREVRAALRHVRDLLAANVAPSQIGILYRSSTIYPQLLREVAAEYALPLQVVVGQPLANTPRIIAALAMLRLPLEGYPRRLLIDVWRMLDTAGVWNDVSPEDAPLAVAASLDRALRSGGIAGGLARITARLQALADTPPPVDDSDFQPLPLLPAEAATVLTHFTSFADTLVPPQSASYATYCAWAAPRLALLWPAGEAVEQTRIHQLLDDLARGATPLMKPPIKLANAEQQRLYELLIELARATTLLAEPPVSYADFVAEITRLITSANYDQQKLTETTVAALPVLAARGMRFDHGILLGLGEGEFPLRLADPPLYTRRERELFTQAGLPLAPPDPADERSLFYETLSRARQSLTLTYTYLDEQGNPIPASPYLKQLALLFPAGSLRETRSGAGSPPPLEGAASHQEKLVALVDGLRQGTPIRESETNAPLLPHVLHARTIEVGREAQSDAGSYTGRLADPVLIERIAKQFGPNHRWSVTQLNDYITCPFRFAAAHVLRLRQPSEPEEGLASAGWGRLAHAILYRAGQTWITQQLPLNAATLDTTLAILRNAAEQALIEAPTTYGFTPGALWEWEKQDVVRRLERALRRATSEGVLDGFTPAAVEVIFGSRSIPPLRLTTDQGPVLVVGRIDRIDQRADKALCIIDYKSSNTPRPLRDTVEARDVQLIIYLLAAEQQIAPGQPVAQALFFHIGSGQFSTPLEANKRQAAEDALQQRLNEVQVGTRSGNFSVQPRDECPKGCTYATICRLAPRS